MYFWLLLQIYPSDLRMLLCSRVTYKDTNSQVGVAAQPLEDNNYNNGGLKQHIFFSKRSFVA